MWKYSGIGIFLFALVLWGCRQEHNRVLEDSVGKPDAGMVEMKEGLDPEDKKYIRDKARTDYSQFEKKFTEDAPEERGEFVQERLDRVKEKQ